MRHSRAESAACWPSALSQQTLSHQLQFKLYNYFNLIYQNLLYIYVDFKMITKLNKQATTIRQLNSYVR